MNQSTKRTVSLAAIIVGIVAMVYALFLDFTGSESSIRGAVLIIGAVLLIFGIYWLPTKKHRMIINVLFLLPLVFTFLVTVIIPFSFGIFYSFTDWNGVKFENFVGLQNYIDMFTEKEYLYSFGKEISILFYSFSFNKEFISNPSTIIIYIFCTHIK